MEALLALVVSTNRIMEAIKRYADRYNTINADVRRFLLLVIQFVVAIASVAIASTGVDVFAGTPFARMSPVLATVTAGLAVGFGADFLHLIEEVTRRLGTSSARG